MKRWAEHAGLALLVALFTWLGAARHRAPPAPAKPAVVQVQQPAKFGAAPGPLGQPAAVQTFDEDLQMTGTRSHPTPVAITGAAPDGGTAAPEPVDTTPGDGTSTIVHFTVATGAGVVKASTGTFIGMNCQNPATNTAGAYVQLYFGQTVLDAGGTNDAGTAPSIVPMYLPVGGNGSLVEVLAMTDGGVWYSSSTQGLLTVDAGVQGVACDFSIR